MPGDTHRVPVLPAPTATPRSKVRLLVAPGPLWVVVLVLLTGVLLHHRSRGRGPPSGGSLSLLLAPHVAVGGGRHVTAVAVGRPGVLRDRVRDVLMCLRDDGDSAAGSAAWQSPERFTVRTADGRQLQVGSDDAFLHQSETTPSLSRDLQCPDSIGITWDDDTGG